MILLHLKKKEPSKKTFIIGWEFITKQQANEIVMIPGLRVCVQESKLPAGFFKEHLNYFFENGIIRYSPTRN